MFNILENKYRTDILKELRRINKEYVLKNTVTRLYKSKNLLTNEVEVFINEVSLSDLIAIKIEHIMSLTKGKIYPILLADIFKLVKLGYVKYAEKNNRHDINQHIINGSYKLKKSEKEREARIEKRKQSGISKSNEPSE